VFSCSEIIFRELSDLRKTGELLHLIAGKRVALASLVSWYNGTLGIRATKLGDVLDITIQGKCRNSQGGVQEGQERKGGHFAK